MRCFVQFKKCEKHPFLQLYLKQHFSMGDFNVFWIYKWYQIAQGVTYKLRKKTKKWKNQTNRRTRGTLNEKEEPSVQLELLDPAKCK